jgi:hypothetical protein
MNHPSRLLALALSSLLLSQACREASDEPRAAPAPAVAPAPPATTPPAPATPSVAPQAPGRIRPDLLPRLHIRQPLGLRADDEAADRAQPAANGDPGTTTTDPAPDEPLPTTAPRRDSPVRRVEVHAIDTAQGEDGQGNLVPAVRPVAIDLVADAWTGRGLDPVLALGELEFRHYQHPGPGVLRFVAADADALPAGRPVWLRWGDRERFQVAPTLEVPR